MKTTIYAAIFGLLLTGLTVAAQAQDAPKHVGPRKVSPAQAGQLDEAGLKSLLVELGYQPEKVQHFDGNPCFRIVVQHGEGTLKHRVILRAESGTVELYCGMDSAMKSGEKNPDAWYRRLSEGMADSQSVARVDKDGGLFVSTYVGGANLTVAGLKAALGRHVKAIDGTLMPIVREQNPSYNAYVQDAPASASAPAPVAAPAIPVKKVRKAS